MTIDASIDAAAIIVTHNSSIHIGGSLTALRAAGLTIRVADNASTDGTPALIERDFPDVTVLASVTNDGFACGVNRAMAGVTTEFVLLVNPDCVLPAPAAHRLIGHLRAHPEVGVAGPRLVNEDGRPAVSAHPFESFTSVVLSRFGGALVPLRLRRRLGGARRRAAVDAGQNASEPVAVDWIAGACLAVRTSLLRELGGLDERYFLYYEDEELCLQAWRHGLRVEFLPDAHAMHVGGASSGEVGATWPHLYRSMLLFFARHRASSYQAVRLVVLLRALLGIGLALVRMALRHDSGPSRARAWRRVVRVALTSHRDTIEGRPA